MRKKISIVIFFIFIGSFVCTILQTSSILFSDLNEESVEEIVDLSERELEKEFQLTFWEAELTHQQSNNASLASFQQYFVTHLIKTYNEPNPVSLFTPPDFLM
jgi:hypothetical protein